MNWHDYFTYDPATGNLIWKTRPREHFNTDRGCNHWNKTYPGRVAGCRVRKPDGSPWHIKFHLMGIGYFLAHRVIWEMARGRIEDGMVIDHKDMNPWNNSLGNLRVATYSENARNCGARKRNTSGHKGVGWDASKRKWRAQISYGGKNRMIGRFDIIEDAIEAYRLAAEAHHGEFART